ncbi:hypothetical protein LCGC14_1801600, partial [marine sediment metagenome]
MIDIRKLLDGWKIEYATTGSNVAKGNVNVKCPMCGMADKSEHMGIKLSNGIWGCWRNKAHRGSNLAYLLQSLLEISYTEAKRLVGDDVTKVDEDALEQ